MSHGNAVRCDLTKAQGGINFLDLKDLARRHGIEFPSGITKRALCAIVNEQLDARTSSTSRAPNLNLPKLTDLYEMKHALGAGSFGQVWEAVEKSTGQTYALKLLKEIGELTKREVATLMQLSLAAKHASCHENLVCYHAQFAALHAFKKERPRKYEIIVMQFVQGPTLFDWRNEWYETHSTPPSVKFVKHVAVGILRALEFMHANGIAHLDIKPENIIVGKGDDPVVIDFGISCSITRRRNTAGAHVDENANANACGATDGWGTSIYLSPQYFENCYLDRQRCTAETRFKTDIWAFGLSILSVLHKVDPISRITAMFDETKDYSQWLKERDWLPPVISKNAQISAIVDAALTPDQRKRPTAQKLLEMLDEQ
jgi:serine/threonine protein kinase